MSCSQCKDVVLIISVIISRYVIYNYIIIICMVCVQLSTIIDHSVCQHKCYLIQWLLGTFVQHSLGC